MNRTTRSISRRKTRFLAAGAGVALVAGGAWTQLGAGADPVSSDVASTCSIATSSVAVSVPITVDDKIDPVVEGGQESLELRTGMPTLPVEATINKMSVTVPIPGQIASVDKVSFAGGNMTGSYALSGSNLILTFTGPQSSKTMELPTVTADQTVKTGIAPTTITWKTFSEIDADTNYGMATCTPNDPNQVLNTTGVEVGDAPAPTTAPPSTEPTTTTTTTTTAPPATGPSTTTTAPPTDESDTAVDVSVSASVTPPAVPSLPTPSAPSVPTPGIPSLPKPSIPAGPRPSLPKVPVPTPSLPTPSIPAVPVPAPSRPPVPAPTLPAPTVPALPVPSLPPVPAPALPPLPALPGIGGDASVVLQIKLQAL